MQFDCGLNRGQTKNFTNLLTVLTLVTGLLSLVPDLKEIQEVSVRKPDYDIWKRKKRSEGTRTVQNVVTGFDSLNRLTLLTFETSGQELQSKICISQHFRLNLRLSWGNLRPSKKKWCEVLLYMSEGRTLLAVCGGWWEFWDKDFAQRWIWKSFHKCWVGLIISSCLRYLMRCKKIMSWNLRAW